MNRPILVRGARQLLTLRGPPGPRRGVDLSNLVIIKDGAVLTDGALIREVGPTRRLENLAESRNALEINATGKIVLPGFVDSHTHLVGGPALLLDYEMQLAGATHSQIADAGGGFSAIYKAVQDSSTRMLEKHAWRVMQDCIRQGTTTIEAKSGYGVTETGEMKILRTQAATAKRLNNIASTLMAARFLPTGSPLSPDEYVFWLCNHLLPAIRRRNLAEFVDVECEGDAFTVEQARRILTTALEAGFSTKLHAGQRGSIGAVRLALEMQAVSIDHAIFVEHEDIALLANSSTIATLLPGSVFYQGNSRYAAARSLIDRGVAVALGTNYNPVSSPSHNMQMMLTLACRKMNMTPAEAISAATINGACAIRRGDRIGSIEAGKQADLIILSVPDYREIPYHFGVNLVEVTIQRGQVIYHASEVKCPPA